MAKRNTDRMLRLINQILDFRKIQNDKMKVLMEQVDIIPLILKSTVILFLWLIRIVLISGCFVLSIPLLCIRMWTNWRRFFLIYLSNAFKYTPDEKSISLSVTCEKTDFCVLQVKR